MGFFQLEIIPKKPEILTSLQKRPLQFSVINLQFRKFQRNPWKLKK
jgi:hypothetical protein